MPSSNHVLVDYRQQRNMNQKQLAADIGVNPSTLYYIENNYGYNNIRKVLRWCRSRNVDPYSVFLSSHDC